MLEVEHVAFQTAEPVKVAEWYCTNLGFRVLRKTESSPFMHFLCDAGNKVVVEIYNNPLASIPDYRAMNPLHLHLAFKTNDLEGERDRLITAGATIAEDIITTPAGDRLIMMRDPWGFAIQLCKRAKPMM